MHEENSVITLTYAPENLPADGGLNIDHFKGFMKRLRSGLAPKKIRFFHCGEYGDKGPGNHPHYHAIIFGHDFSDDRYYFTTTKAGSPQYRSPYLESKWEFGFSTIGDMSWQGAAYISRYVTKKIYGEKAEEHYNNLRPEYLTMSRRPGIGHSYFAKHHTDVFPDDFIVIDGRQYSVPRYYDELYEEMFPTKMEEIRAKRKTRNERLEKKYFDENPESTIFDRGDVKEEILEKSTKKLIRGYENESESLCDI